VSARNELLDEHCAEVNIEARPGPHVIIGVDDTGSGIPPDVLDRIFEPFFTTKDLGKGTGLGLSSTLAIVKSHGGFVRVSTEMNAGTQFRVYLPASTTAEPDQDAPVESDLPRGNGELVLLVDDEDAVRDIIKHTLEAFGYRVLAARDGAEATALYPLHQSEIAVVITDMMMPVMDGPETIRVLLGINPQVRIIAASGMGTQSMVAKTLAAGVRQFLPKPYTAETLLQGLRLVLRE
jgi:CheY-like chemotaxis protein